MKARLIFTSDVHGFLMPTDYASRDTLPQGLSCLANSYKKDGNTIIIDGGDMLQGSPLTSVLEKEKTGGKIIAEAMNLAGYDICAIGNHDFNYGIENLSEYSKALKASLLCCNISDKEGLIKASKTRIISLESGLRIGFVGACTHHVTKWEPKETLDRLNITPPLEAIRQAYNAIESLCDIKVLVYHGGFERDVDTGRAYTTSDENQAYLFAQSLDFDLVLTGHQHADIINKTINNSHVVQVSNNAKRYADIEIELKDGKKHIKSSFVESALPPYAPIVDYLSNIESRVQNALDDKLATIDAELKNEPPLERAKNGSLLANFISQVQKDAAKCRVSGASIPGNGLSLPKTLSVREVLIAYPYANTLVVLLMSGNQLKEYIEKSAEYFDYDDKDELRVADRFLFPKESHYNYDYISGVFYEIDLRRKEGDRVTKMEIDGREIKENDEIEVCVNSYRAQGSGGYDFILKAKRLREINYDIAQLIIDYLTKNKNCIIDKTKYYRVIEK